MEKLNDMFLLEKYDSAEVKVPTAQECEKLYSYYNAHYFNNILPQNLTIEVSTKMSRAWGKAGFRFAQDANGDYRVEPMFIKICSIRKISDFALKSTLLHEMVHIYDYITNPQHFIVQKNGIWQKVRYDTHGNWFMNNEVSTKIRKDGFIIERYVQDEQKSGAEFSDATQLKAQEKVKQGVYALVGIFDGKTYFKKITYGEAYVLTNSSKLRDLKSRYKGCEAMYIVKTTNPNIALKRATTRLHYINLDINNECEILQEVQ